MGERFLHIYESVLQDPNGVKMPNPISDNFDKCLLHIDDLLSSAILLSQNRRYTQALFLAITAVEESVKAEVYCFRSKNENNGRPAKDSLKKHEIKHKAAVNEEILLIGKRVQNVIGDELTVQIYDNFGKGKTRELRENCLYFEVQADKLIIPTENITPKIAISYILACIEIIDDKLVGWTNLSMKLSTSFDKYFDTLKTIYNSLC